MSQIPQNNAGPDRAYEPVLIEQPAKVAELIVRINEAARGDPSEEKIGRFIEPVPGTLMEAKSKQHHIVFGRRGSGKSSLLRKAQRDLSEIGHAVAYIDLDIYKNQTLANLLVSITYDVLKQCLEFMSRHAIVEVDKELQRLKLEVESLRQLLDRPDEAKAQESLRKVKTSKKKNELKGTASLASYFKVSGKTRKEAESEEDDGIMLRYAKEKQQAMFNNISRFRELLAFISRRTGKDVFIVVDELYHINQEFQPITIEYLHSLVRNNRAWLKIGTVRYRSRLFVRGEEGTKGLEVGQDVQTIDLDASFEAFAQTEKFLSHILATFIAEVGLGKLENLASETATKRLIQSSGGVARDFLLLFVRSLRLARERLAKDSNSRRRISADDVWDAAGIFNKEKRQEFESDVRVQSSEKLRSVVLAIRDFCFENELNCFLVADDCPANMRILIDEVWDCKLLHKVKAGIWVEAQLHTAYMLDISEQAFDWHMRRFVVDLGVGDRELKAKLSDKKYILTPKDIVHSSPHAR